MKAKIIFGVLAGLWALALIPRFISAVIHINAPLGFLRVMGGIAGICIFSSISIILLRGTLKR